MRTRTTPLIASALLAACIAMVPTPALAADARSTSVVVGVPLTGSSAVTVAAEQAEPDPEAEGGRLAFVLIPLLGAAVVVVGAIVVISRGRRGRRGD